MVYKPLAVRVALIAVFRRALPVFRYMRVVATILPNAILTLLPGISCVFEDSIKLVI